MKHASNGREEFQQQANKGKNLHAQRAEEVKVLMSARNAWRQHVKEQCFESGSQRHLGEELGRVCPGQAQRSLSQTRRKAVSVIN